MLKNLLLLFVILLSVTACSSNNELRTPQTLTRTDYLEVNYRMQPHIKKARESLPYIKGRYMKGLPAGEKLYLTIKLYDPDKSFEYLDVAVEDWYAEDVLGKISSQVFVLQHYHQGDLVDFTEDSVIDWTLVKADGSKEGGYVRKFLKGCAANKMKRH